MNHFLIKLSRFVNQPTYVTNIIVGILIIVLNILGGTLVYQTGGTTFSYLHVMYIPIILCGYYFGPVIGVLGGLFSGIIIGPDMPESISMHHMQTLHTWIFRTSIFAVVGGLSGLFSTLSKAYLYALEKQIYYDPVTDLPNYQGLLQKLDKGQFSKDTISAIVIIKLKQLGDIEKAFGPHLAEKLLKMLAHQLNQVITKMGMVARMGGGKFVVLVFKPHSIQYVIQTCNQVLIENNTIEGIPLFLEFLYGYAKYEKNNNLNDLLKKASNTLAHFLDSDFFETHYDSKLDQQAERNIVILRELQIALQGEGLSLYYQPKLDIKTGKIMGFEALSRWNHPTLGHVPTYQYITLAEKTSLIGPYTKWVLTKAIQQLADWHKRGVVKTIAVNFSTANFTDPDVITEMFELLKKYQVPPHYLEIEITESALADNLEKVAEVLRIFQNNQINIAVDDFGTGLSSLKYLFELPVNILKIDLVFIQAMLQNPAADAIVRNTIKLAHELNFKVVAEGVETEAQFQHLVELGCDIAQGYLISKPMPEEEVLNWLHNRQ